MTDILFRVVRYLKSSGFRKVGILYVEQRSDGKLYGRSCGTDTSSSIGGCKKIYKKQSINRLGGYINVRSYRLYKFVEASSLRPWIILDPTYDSSSFHDTVLISSQFNLSSYSESIKSELSDYFKLVVLCSCLR